MGRRNRGLVAAAIWLPLTAVSCGQTSASAPTTPSPSAVATSPAPRPSPTPAPAQRLELSLPAPVEETAAASAGGRLYVLGGFDAAGRSLDSVFIFDGAGWRAGPRLPLPVDHPSAATLDGKVYLAGGHTFGRDSARLFRLDGSAWMELAPMHFARGGHALIAAHGRLYAVGGNTSRGNVPAIESYDPAANAWTVLPPLPAPRNHVSGFVIGAAICVAGGRSPNTARVDCFNPDQGAWSTIASLPRATSGGGATTFATGEVVMMGGEDAGEAVMVDQLTYYSQTGGWTSGEAMMAPRHGFQLAVFEGRAWACGGATAPGLHPVATCTSVIDRAVSPRGR